MIERRRLHVRAKASWWSEKDKLYHWKLFYHGVKVEPTSEAKPLFFFHLMMTLRFLSWRCDQFLDRFIQRSLTTSTFSGALPAWVPTPYWRFPNISSCLISPYFSRHENRKHWNLPSQSQQLGHLQTYEDILNKATTSDVGNAVDQPFLWWVVRQPWQIRVGSRRTSWGFLPFWQDFLTCVIRRRRTRVTIEWIPLEAKSGRTSPSATFGTVNDLRLFATPTANQPNHSHLPCLAFSQAYFPTDEAAPACTQPSATPATTCS